MRFERKGREYFGFPPLQFFKPCKGMGSFPLPTPSLPFPQTKQTLKRGRALYRGRGANFNVDVGSYFMDPHYITII